MIRTKIPFSMPVGTFAITGGHLDGGLSIREVRTMSSMTLTARQFFDACESGKGCAICKQWCTPEATFAAQAEPLMDVRTLWQYTDWTKGLLGLIPDGRYEVRSFALDEEHHAGLALSITPARTVSTASTTDS